MNSMKSEATVRAALTKTMNAVAVIPTATGCAVAIRATKREATKIAALKLAGVRNSADARVLGAKAMRVAAFFLEHMTFDADVEPKVDFVNGQMVQTVAVEVRGEGYEAAAKLLAFAVASVEA